MSAADSPEMPDPGVASGLDDEIAVPPELALETLAMALEGT
ncbi:MAG: hypothetical protein JWP17_1075, partial [Solirubrobacterales bacterium]|nr:hypothetical protein [Solirubrobacterales bacterium]